MLKRTISLTLLAVVGLAFCSCTSVDYSGSTFGPTTKVKVYYDKSRINKKFTVMGKATASTWYSYQNSSLRPALIEKAKASGADAILIQSINQSVAPPARRGSNNQIDNGKMSANHVGVDGNTLLPNKQSNQTTVAVDTSQIVAEFLKLTDQAKRRL